jgi:hypothetical protein
LLFTVVGMIEIGDNKNCKGIGGDFDKHAGAAI